MNARNSKLQLLHKFMPTLMVAACVLELTACQQTESSGDRPPEGETKTETFKTIASKPRTVDDAYQMAVDGDYDAALKAVQSILRKDPHNIAALKIRAECYFAKKLYVLAITDLNEVLKSDPSRGSYFLRAQIYQSSQKHHLAEADYGRVVALDLKQVQSKSDQAPPLKTRIIHLIYLADSLEHQAKWEKAVQLYSRILTIEKDDQNSIHGRARDLIKLARPDAALLDLNHLVRLIPDDGGLRVERAECLFKLGKAADARADLVQAKVLKPTLGKQIEKLLATHKRF